jgi:drug/metabolite transporter (DMT)-like permease
MKTIKRIGVLSAAKVAAIIYFLIAAIIFIPMGLITTIMGGAASDNPFFAFGGGLFLLFMPFLYAGLGFVAVAIGCFIYNLASQWIGGVEVELSSDSEQKSSEYLDAGVE